MLLAAGDHGPKSPFPENKGVADAVANQVALGGQARRWPRRRWCRAQASDQARNEAGEQTGGEKKGEDAQDEGEGGHGASTEAQDRRSSPDGSIRALESDTKGGGVIKLKRILVPTDFSDTARHALTYGLSFCREYGAELILIHVVETIPVGYASDLFPVPMAEVFQEMAGYAKEELQKLAAEAKERGVAAREIVTQGKPSAEIVRVAREEGIDLIVLGTHGKGVLDKAIFGSTTDRVVRKAPCPVLTVGQTEHEFVE